MKKMMKSLMAAIGVALTMTGSVFAADVAKIGENGYATFAEALTAAKAMTGDVTVEIYEKVTLNTSLSGSYSSITFVGKDTDAEIYLEVQGYITATGKTVNFQDLKLSKSQGVFITNAGFMNTAFGVYDVKAVNYTNCTFSNGAYASSGTVTFTKCIFKRSWDKYGLWAYGDVNCIVDECIFDDYRGIKMYAEGAAKTTDLTVKNSNFSAVTDKPAIVLTYGESVNLEGNTYSSTGTFELDLDGAPNGVAVTSDVAPTCKNDNGACGVLVDGKIYTTVAQAAAVATSGSTVTLLHDSTETVELPEGVTLNKNNFTAAGVTVAQPVDPNTHYINNLDELKAFRDAVNNGNTYEGMTVKLAQDIDLEGSDANLWTPIGANADASAMVFKGTFDGQGHKIFNLYVKQGAGYHAAGLFGATRGTVKNLTIENAYVESLSSGSATVNGTAVVAGSTAYGATIDNVHVKTATVKGNRYVAGIVGYMDGKVTNCTVEDVTIIATPDNLTGAYDNGDKVGGIVGYCNSGAKEISNCALKGENSLTAYRDVAGIVGCASSGVSVSDNTATGKLTVTVDQMTNSYGEKTPNAGTLYGRNATAEMQAENAEAKADTEKLAYSESIVKGSAKIGNTYYATLADALAAVQGSENIVIDLLADATLDITAWETLAIGGDATKTITINGNGNTLTFNKLNSDWNHIVTKNDAKLILNDMTITDSGYNNGPWNRYDINFACDVELNDVTSTKALAFKADATLNDVAVIETNDAYAIWIQPNGQNVVIDGLTVDSAGRGIKIDEQYVDAASKVELSVKDATFTTAKKAAIVVKSAAGADITLENVDISGVAADNVNAVWNDEDSAAVYGNITVTGGTLAQENIASFVAAVQSNGNIIGYYTSINAALAAAQAGDTIELLADIAATEVILLDKNLTINGNGHKVTSSATRVFRITKGNTEVTLNGVNMISTAVRVGTNDIRGISIDILDNVELTLNNCSVDFTDPSANDWAYAVNVTGGSNHTLTVNGGTYEGANVINVRGENNVVTVTDATLNSMYPNNDQYYGAGIWVEEEKGSSVTATNNTFNGANAVAFNLGTGTTLTESNNTDNTTRCVAKIGEQYYTSLEEALAAAQAGDTVTVLPGDYTTALNVDKAIIVVGQTDAEGNNLVNINGKLNVTANNATVRNINVNNGSNSAGYINAKDVLIEGCSVVGGNGFRSCYTSGTVTFRDSTITGAVYGIHFDGSAGGNIVIDDCEITGWTSFAGAITNVAISDTEFKNGNYNQLRFYQNAQLTNVTFNENMTVDFGKNEVEATFIDCAVADGSVLTDVIYLGDIVEMGVDVTINNEPVVVAAKVTDANGDAEYFITLQAAVDAAQDGETVALIADVNESIVVAGKAVTLDLNGKTVSGVEGSYDTVYIEDADLTVQDSGNTGKIVCKDGPIYDAVCLGANANFTLNGGTLESDKEDVIYIYDYGSESSVAIVNGTINGSNALTAWNGVSTISGGIITGNLLVQEPATLSVTGGTFTVDPSEFAAYGYGATDNGDGTWTVGEMSKNIFIGETAYLTLDEAFKAATENDVIEIKAAGEYIWPATAIPAGVTVKGAVDGVVATTDGKTIINATTFTVENIDFAAHNYAAFISNPATTAMTFTDCSFTPSSPELYAICVDTAAEDAVFTFNDCVFNGFATFTSKVGTLDVNGGEINAGFVVRQDATIDGVEFAEDARVQLGTTDTVTDVNVTITGCTVADTNGDGNVPAVKDLVNETNTAIGSGNVVIVDGDVIYGAVAKIGDTYYETLAAALAAAQDGETVELLWAEGNAPIAMNGSVYGKSVTITGSATVDWSKGFLFVGRGGEGNGTVIFDNANLESASNNASTGIHVSGREKNTNNKYDGTVVINNSTIVLDYLIDKGAMTMTNSTLTVKNGFAVGGRPASETESGVDATATFDLTNGSTLIVNNHNGMGLGYEAIGVMNIDGTSKFECTQNFLVTAKGMLNIANGGQVELTDETKKTLTINGTLTSAGNVFADIVAGTDANIELTGGIYTDEEVQGWCADRYVALRNFEDRYVVGVAPAAEVENLGATTVAAGGYTVVTPFGGSNSTSDPMELPFVMKYVAVETPEAGAASPYADWYGDFVITFSGLKNGSISGAGCYLAGHYGTFGWVKVPVDNLTIENGVRYPVMLSTLGNGQKYDYICGGVDTFLCAMYLPESVLEENPDLKVSLELCVVDNANGPEAAQQALATADSPYAYQSAVKEFGAQDFIDVELPEVEVVDIKNTLTDSDPDLTFALNFAIKDMENLTEEYLEKLFAKYGNYYTDYVLTISGLFQESVTFNANGDADGYLAGQYDAWSQNWVSVPFENVTVENGQSLYIMEYAAKLMNKQGLRFTLAEVAEIVQNFDCGVYFTPEFLAANPDLKVDLELKVFTEDQNGNKINDISVATNTFDKDDFGVAAVVAEGKQTRYFASLAEAFTDVENGETVMILAPGTYALTTSGKNITVTGAVDGVVFDNIGKKNMGGANVTFNNVTFDYYPNVNYTGLQHSGDLVYNNCTFDGQVFLYGASEIFNNCTFNQNSADAYNVWTYTADVVNFNECTFNSAGKSVLVYNENSAEFNTVNVAKCEFNASAPVDGKAAIEMDSSLTAGINLTIDAATTATGFGSGNVSGNSLWNNKKGNSTDANNDITVVVNNETVLAPVTFVAKIGNVGYITLQAAVDAAKNGETVNLLAACAENVIVAQNPDIAFTIEGNGNEMTGTITVDGKSSAYPAAGLTIKNIAFDATEITEDASINLGGSNNTRYTSNVTVLGCSFIDSNSDKDKAAVKNYTGGCKNLTVSGCSAQGMHSLIQVKGVAGITVSDIEIAECKNGISVGTSTGVTIANADIDVEGYGFRADGSGAYDAIVENCKITAELPVVIRKNTADGYALTLNGENELNGTNGNAYAVVFTNGDDGTYEIPAGNFIYTNNGNEVKVYPVSAYVAEVGGKKYVELEEALKALSDGATLKLLADIEIDGTWDCRFNGAKITANNVKINGNGKTIKLTGTVDDKNWNTVFRFEGKGVWVQNLTLDVSEAKGVQRGITAKFDIAVIQSTFIGNGTTSKYGLIFGEGAGNEIGGLEINVIASTFKDWTYGVADNRNGQDVRYINMDANVFDNANVIVSASKTVYFDNNKMDGGYVNISSYTVPNDLYVHAQNSKVDADFADKNRIVADRIANANGFLTPVAKDEIGKLYLFLDEAIDAGSVITIRDNINTDSAFVISKQITIDLNGKTIATTENDKSGDGVFHVVAGGDLTIEDGSADKTGTINGVGGNNYNIAVWADGGKVTINGGNFTNVGATDENGNNHFDLIYAKNGGEVVINGGKFECESPAWTLNIHDGSRQDSSITVNGGTFVGFDPRNNAAETAGTTFMAPGKYTLVEGGSYSVVTPTDYILNGAASDAAAVNPIDAALAGAVTVTKDGDKITATATYTFKVTAVDTVNPEKSEYELTGGTLRPGKSVKVKYIDLENGGATLTEKPASGPVIFKLVID